MCSEGKHNTSIKDLSPITKVEVNSNVEVKIEANNTGSFTDTRDGQIYTWVELKDGKKWMSQNLNYEITDSWCFKNDSSNCQEYGRLYTWEAAQKACPEGWRLPSDGDWRTMAIKYGGCNYDDPNERGNSAYKALLAEGDSGFSAKFSGYRTSYNVFLHINVYGRYWTSSAYDTKSAWFYDFNQPQPYEGLYRERDKKGVAFSCRCIQD